MPQYQVSHTLVPGALEAASTGVPPVMYQPRNPYASAAYVEGGNGVSPLIGYPSQYPHVVHYTPRPVPASIYEPIPTYADAMSLARAISPVTPPRSVIGSIPSTRSSAPAAAQAAPAQAAPAQSAAPKPAEQAPAVAPAQPAPEFKPDPANAGGGGGGGGVGPEPAGSAMPNLFRGYVNPNYPDVAPKAPRLQEILTMPFSEWPDAISRWWNNRDTPSSAFAGDATPSPATDSSYWGTMGAQNTARRALGLDEVAGPSRPANPAMPRSTVPAELTTPPDLMAQLQAQGTVVPQDKLPPVVTPTVTELAAPAPYKPRDVLPPEVQIRAVQAPTRAPVGQSNGSIPAPVYRDKAPADTTPTVLSAPVPVDVLGPIPEWYRTPAVRQYDRPNVSDDPGSDLPFGIGAAADLYYNRIRPGYRENVAPVMDAAGDTLAAAARVGQDIATQAYNKVDKSLNEYWAQFFANQFAKRGPLEGKNLQDYLTQAQNLGFYNEALQYLGR